MKPGLGVVLVLSVAILATHSSTEGAEVKALNPAAAGEPVKDEVAQKEKDAMLDRRTSIGATTRLSALSFKRIDAIQALSTTKAVRTSSAGLKTALKVFKTKQKAYEQARSTFTRLSNALAKSKRGSDPSAWNTATKAQQTMQRKRRSADAAHLSYEAAKTAFAWAKKAASVSELERQAMLQKHQLKSVVKAKAKHAKKETARAKKSLLEAVKKRTKALHDLRVAKIGLKHWTRLSKQASLNALRTPHKADDSSTVWAAAGAATAQMQNAKASVMTEKKNVAKATGRVELFHKALRGVTTQGKLAVNEAIKAGKKEMSREASHKAGIRRWRERKKRRPRQLLSTPSKEHELSPMQLLTTTESAAIACSHQCYETHTTEARRLCLHSCLARKFNVSAATGKKPGLDDAADLNARVVLLQDVVGEKFEPESAERRDFVKRLARKLENLSPLDAAADAGPSEESGSLGENSRTQVPKPKSTQQSRQPRVPENKRTVAVSLARCADSCIRRPPAMRLGCMDMCAPRRLAP